MTECPYGHWTFRQLSVRLQNLPSTSVKFLCVRATICQFSIRQRDLPSTSVNLLCVRGTFRKLSLTFYASVGHPSNIHAAAGFLSTFINFMYVSEIFRKLSVCPRDLPSTSINFLSVCVKYFVRKLDLPLNFRQLSVWLWDLLLTFHASAGTSVNFC